MKRQEKKEMIGRVYREFSRQKYTKYRHQFPRMRESEIISKIIKEWESLDSLAKEDLQKKYEEHKFLTQEDINQSELMAKKEKKSALHTLRARQAASPESPVIKSPNVKVYIEKPAPKPPSSESADYNRISERNESQFDSQSDRLIILPKTKRIQKGGGRPSNSEYLAFFKYYFDKLKGEHPRWTSNQISSIIRLLWKKRSNSMKTRQSRTHLRLRRGKILSGRTYFRKLKNREGLTTPEATNLWKRFPRQTRIRWTREARGDSAVVHKRLLETTRLTSKYVADSRSEVGHERKSSITNLSFIKTTLIH